MYFMAAHIHDVVLERMKGFRTCDLSYRFIFYSVYMCSLLFNVYIHVYISIHPISPNPQSTNVEIPHSQH